MSAIEEPPLLHCCASQHPLSPVSLLRGFRVPVSPCLHVSVSVKSVFPAYAAASFATRASRDRRRLPKDRGCEESPSRAKYPIVAGCVLAPHMLPVLKVEKSHPLHAAGQGCDHH